MGNVLEFRTTADDSQGGGFRPLALGVEPPHVDYIVDPIIPAGRHLFWLGAAGSSKTQVARFLTLAAAFQGHRVLYFSEDMNEQDDGIFLTRVLLGLGKPTHELPPTMRWLGRQGATLANHRGVDKVFAEVDYWQPDLVVFDTYNSLYAGGRAASGEENWNTAAAYAALLKRLGGVGVITILHPPVTRPHELPGGNALSGTADQVVLFEGSYQAGSPRSDFAFGTTKNSRLPGGFSYTGTILGKPSVTEPLTMDLLGKPWTVAPKANKDWTPIREQPPARTLILPASPQEGRPRKYHRSRASTSAERMRRLRQNRHM